MDAKTKERLLRKKSDIQTDVESESEDVQTPPNIVDTVKGWFGGTPKRRLPLKERVAQLKAEAISAEERAKLTEEGVEAQRRIVAAEQRRLAALKRVSGGKRKLGVPAYIIMGVLAVVLILIIVGAIRC